MRMKRKSANRKINRRAVRATVYVAIEVNRWPSMCIVGQNAMAAV